MLSDLMLLSLPPALAGGASEVLFSNLFEIHGKPARCTDIIISCAECSLILSVEVQNMDESQIHLFEGDSLDPDFGSYLMLKMRLEDRSLGVGDIVPGRFGDSLLSVIHSIGNFSKIKWDLTLDAGGGSTNAFIAFSGIYIHGTSGCIVAVPSAHGTFELLVK